MCVRNVTFTPAQTHTNPISLHIPDLNSICNDTQSDPNIANDRLRHNTYVPCLNGKYSAKFEQFIRSTILNELSDIQANVSYFEGWKYVDDISDMDRFLWVYQHQTHTVYIKGYSRDKTVYKIYPLCHEKWFGDTTDTDKYIKQIAIARYDCQRTKSNNKKVIRTFKTDCHCHILIRYYQVYNDKKASMPCRRIIAVFSDNYIESHCGHDLSSLYVSIFICLHKCLIY